MASIPCAAYKASSIHGTMRRQQRTRNMSGSSEESGDSSRPASPAMTQGPSIFGMNFFKSAGGPNANAGPERQRSASVPEIRWFRRWSTSEQKPAVKEPQPLSEKSNSVAVRDARRLALTEQAETVRLRSSTESRLENSPEALTQPTRRALQSSNKPIPEDAIIPNDVSTKPISVAVRRLSPGIAEHFASEESPMMQTARRLSTALPELPLEEEAGSIARATRRFSSVLDESLNASDTSSVMKMARRMSVTTIKATPEPNMAGPVLQTARRLSTISHPACSDNTEQTAGAEDIYKLSLQDKRATLKRQKSDPVRFRRISPLAMGDVISVDWPVGHLDGPPLSPSGLGKQLVVRIVEDLPVLCEQIDMTDTEAPQMAVQIQN